MRTLHGIQYLRAAAALGVVVFHAAERTGGDFAIGAAGVDVFFVISGFIMWVIASEKSPSPSAFLRERVERIAPSYWTATGVMVAGALAGLFPNMRLTASYVLASVSFIPSVSPATGRIWPVLVQGWTLNYEMFFYALFAVSLLVSARHRFVFLAAAFLALVAAGWLARPEGAILKTWTDPLLLEFLLGIVIGKAWLDGKVPPPAAGAALVACAVAGFALVGAGYIGFTSLVLAPLAAALVVGVLALERSDLISRFRPASYLGDASYSIYLWHTLAISVVARLGAMFPLPAPVACGAAIVLGVAVGVAAHEILEKPMVRFLKAQRRGRAAISA